MPTDKAHNPRLGFETAVDDLRINTVDRPEVRFLEYQILREIDRKEESLPDKELNSNADTRTCTQPPILFAFVGAFTKNALPTPPSFMYGMIFTIFGCHSARVK